MSTHQIILASASPRRKQLLEWAEILFDVMVQNTDESFPTELTPKEAAVHIAFQKALAAKANCNKDCTIIAADTIVVLNNKIIGKPKDKEDALNILSALQGNTHQVITGVAIIKNDKEILFADVTEVEFNELTKDQLKFYIEKYKPYDKAGAYAIQEWIGVVGIKKINGDFYNVMGLPVNKVVKALKNI